MAVPIEQIIENVESGRITTLSLDTSIFDQHHLRLESGLLARLKQFAGSDNGVCFSDIVLREVEMHLAKEAEVSQKELKAALRTVEHTWQLANVTSISSALFPEGTTPREVAAKRLRTYLESISAKVIPHDPQVLTEVLNRYFEERPPFSNQKKAEFPDAIALLSLERWAIDNDTIILVVTKDNDWTEFCSTSEHLIAMSDLSAALSCFQSETARFASELIRKQILGGDTHGFGEVIRLAIKENFENVIFDPQSEIDFDFDIESLILLDIPTMEFAEPTDDDAFEPIEMSDSGLVLRLRVYPQIKIAVELVFLTENCNNPEAISIGSSNLTVDQILEFITFVTFKVGSVRHALPANLTISSVEVPKQYHFLELGDNIGPGTDSFIPSG